MIRYLLPLVALSPVLLAGCGAGAFFLGSDGDDQCVEPSGSGGGLTDEEEPNGIHGFASEQDLDAYMASIEAKQAAFANSRTPCPGNQAADSGANSSSGGPGAASPPSNEEITNNQEAGVDEGGIVKNVGDSLVVLRKGRLYVVDVGAGRPPSQTDTIRVARTESLNSQVWYDEMLVKGDLVYVVGYRYGVAAPGDQVRGATEIDSFRLANGKLERLRSIFLESNDYYSGDNYASRMVDGKLVFYMPHYIGRKNNALAYPRLLEARDDGQFNVVGPIFGALDVFTSLKKPAYATFHTIVSCALPTDGSLSCHGRSVIGSWWNERYVSPDSVFLWASSHVYKFDFASLDVSAHKAEGAPLDQFSFRQGEGDLFVGTTAYDSSKTEAQLLRLPLAAFDKSGKQGIAKTVLGDGGIAKNRFVGDSFLAALWTKTDASELVSFNPITGTKTSAALARVVRIEPLGEGRALVALAGANGVGLELRSLATADLSSLGSVSLPNLAEGEARSHGFFYKPGAAGAGTFGYAVLNPPNQGASWGWGNGISNIGFFDVGAGGSLAAIGIVSSGGATTTCEVSCFDWYGNTRPVFLGDRVYALMGSELAEVALRPGATKQAGVELTVP